MEKNENIYIYAGNNEYNISESIKEDNFTKYKSAIPPLAYLYFPPNNYIISFNEKEPKKSQRCIFETNQYESFYMEYEKNELNKFFQSQNINNKNEDIITLPKSDILRFLQATQYNHEKSRNFLINHQKWLNDIFPVKFNDKINEILNLGFIYVQGRDYCFRPIIVLQIEVFIKNKSKFQFEDWNKAIIYLLEYIKYYMLIPGQIENWVVIVNFENCSLLTLPNEFKMFIQQMQDNYRSRLGKSFIVGLSPLMSFFLKLVISCLEETTQKKIQILDKKNLLIYINDIQLEKQFNGKTKVKEKCFPPEFDYSFEFDYGCLPNQILKNYFEKISQDLKGNLIDNKRCNINLEKNIILRTLNYDDSHLPMKDILENFNNHFDCLISSIEYKKKIFENKIIKVSHLYTDFFKEIHLFKINFINCSNLNCFENKVCSCGDISKENNKKQLFENYNPNKNNIMNDKIKDEIFIGSRI